MLFLNRPEGPLENSLSGIILSGGKNDQNLLQTAASEKSHTECRPTPAGAGPGGPPASRPPAPRRGLAQVSLAMAAGHTALHANTGVTL